MLEAAGDLSDFGSARELYLHLVETQGKLIGQMVGTPTLGQGVPSSTLRQWATRYITEGPVTMQKAAISRTSARRLKRSLLERTPNLAPPQPRGLPGRRFRRVREEEEPLDLYETEAPEVFEDDVEEVSERHPRLPHLPSRRMHFRKVSRTTARLHRRRRAGVSTVVTPFAREVLDELQQEGLDGTDEDILFEVILNHVPDVKQLWDILSEKDTTVQDLVHVAGASTDVVTAIQMYVHDLIAREVQTLFNEQEANEEFEGI